MKKKSKQNSSEKFVSKKRVKEIEKTFETLEIVNNTPFLGGQDFGKNFQRVSLYESNGVVYTTSGNTNR